MAATAAIRARVTGAQPPDAGLREGVVERASGLGVLGWVRAADDGALRSMPKATPGGRGRAGRRC